MFHTSMAGRALAATVAGSFTASATAATEPPANTFSVVSAAATAGNPDQVTVVADSPSSLTGLTAEFVVNGTDAYSQSLTQQSSQTDPADPAQTQTTWTAKIPAGPSGLPLGNYVIDLHGTFAGSATYTTYGSGTFSFDATSTVTLSATRTSLTYPDASTTLSGQVTLTYPDGTPDTDYSPSTTLGVRIQSGGTIIDDLPISGDGTFSDPDFTPPVSESVEAEIIGYGVTSSVSSPVALTVTTITPALKWSAP